MSKQKEDIDIEFLGGATSFDDFTGVDTHQFDFNISIDGKTENIEIYVAGNQPEIDRVGMTENFEIVFKDEATLKYVMDEMNKVIKEEINKEHQDLLQFEQDIKNGVGIFGDNFDDKKIESEEKPKQKTSKGFSPSM